MTATMTRDAETSTTTVELTISNEAGENVTTWPSEAAARQHVFEYALMNWAKHSPCVLDGETADRLDRGDPDTTIAVYFAAVEDLGHWFSIAVPMLSDEPVHQPSAHELREREAHAKRAAEVRASQQAQADEWAEWRAAAAAHHAAKWAAKYPTRWPAKHRPVLDEVRAVCRDFPLWRWHWLRDSGDGPDRPKGSFVLECGPLGQPPLMVEVFETLDDLAAAVFPVGDTAPKPKRASSKTGKAQLVTILRRVVDMTRLGYIDRSIIDEAERLLEKA